jgi:hypothetical protein
MSGYGPSQHFAPPNDFGRKPGIAEVDWQPSIAEATLVTQSDLG